MKLVFFGTADFSLNVLKSIFHSQHEIVAVVCPLDKPSGRGGKIIPSVVKQFALDNNIPVLQYRSVSREAEQTLKSLNADLFISASFGQIFRQNIIDIAPYGIVNVHASLLPKYRGASPIQYCLYNGEKETGITIMQTDAGMDTGDIYLQKKIEIREEDNADSLFEKLSILGGDAIVEFLDNYNFYKTKRYKQDENLATLTKIITEDMSKINFNNTPLEIVNFIKGNCSKSTAYFIYNGQKIKVFSAKSIIFAENDNHFENGMIINAHTKTGLHIACTNGAIDILELQLAGKKKMTAKDFLNGTKIEVGSLVEL